MESRSLNLAFFWHMHQPDYRDSQGVMMMPWVFLHAIKDYYEMPWLLSQHSGLKATFNITAPLIEQINLYRDPLNHDHFLSLWAKHPSELNTEEKAWFLKICKSTQYETMIKPIAELDRLYHLEVMRDAELIDFQVLFLLTWCGNYLRQNDPLVQSLFAQAKGFTSSDKAKLLQTLCDFTQEILPFYAKLQEQGVISLATTPYNHPILPLLLDMENAKEANPHTALPDNPMPLREDAIAQVERSMALYQETFGRQPTGFWPAEGAVDEASIAIYQERGIRWIATDEAILFRSLGSDNRTQLYRPYRFDGMTIGFRDHGLSDLIGFNYRFKSGEEASRHFMQTVEPIAREQEEATLFIILDGENAWEFFEDNAYDFFTTLYATLSQTPWCKSVTMDEVAGLERYGRLSRVAPGSWIHGNFDTWSGHSEKNRAWELIFQTRRDVENYQGTITPEVAEAIRFHFLAAECSDWFWWYGDDHVTDFSIEFDKLFREHLITIYQLLAIQPPSDLFEPIMANRSSFSFLVKPQQAITPVIDGKNGSFFEWLGAGSVDESKLYSTMDRVRGPIQKIYYGHDEHAIYLAFEGDVASLERATLHLQVVTEESGKTFDFEIGKAYNELGTVLAVDERIELALSRSHFGTLTSVHLRFEILKGSEIVQMMPGYGALAIDLNESYEQNWFV